MIIDHVAVGELGLARGEPVEPELVVLPRGECYIGERQRLPRVKSKAATVADVDDALR